MYLEKEKNMTLKKPKSNQIQIKPRGRKRKLVASIMLILRLVFGGPQSASAGGNSKNVQDGVGSKAVIYKTFSQESSMIGDLNQDDSTQSKLVTKGSQRTIISSSGKNILIIPPGGDNPGKFGPGSKARGAAKSNFARRQTTGTGKKPTSGRPGGIGFAQAFTVKANLPARPGQNRDGLLGRFSGQPTPDPYNTRCGGGPRSITVVSQSKSSEQDPGREITAHDGVKGLLTDKSTNHLTSRHGNAVGIDDPVPPNPNQKPTKYKQTRTRITKKNKKIFGDTVEEILQDPVTETYPDITIRGIKGHGYRTENYGEYGFFVGIHTEGQFAGEIKKSQPISKQPLKTLQEENKID